MMFAGRTLVARRIPTKIHLPRPARPDHAPAHSVTPVPGLGARRAPGSDHTPHREKIVAIAPVGKDDGEPCDTASGWALPARNPKEKTLRCPYPQSSGIGATNW